MHETEAEQKARISAHHKDALKALFVKRQELEQKLRDTDALIKEHGDCYWLCLGYTVMPRIERLRAAILGA